MVPGNPGRAPSLITLALARWRGWTSGPFRAQMIRTARRAPRQLGRESTALVHQFLFNSQNVDGGFQDRNGRSDLYYSVFGIQASKALNVPFRKGAIRDYLAGFGGGEGLDFVHLCCLARCRALAGATHGREPLARRIEAFRAADGGYHPMPGSADGTAYAAFLALGAYQDLRVGVPEMERLGASLDRLSRPEVGWANEPAAPAAAVNSTVAAMAVLGRLGRWDAVRSAAQWLLRQAHPLGGFRAAPLSPMPDLLSTATALHALAAAGVSLDPVREACLDFLDSLWSNVGGFHGHWQDEVPDVEYTFYGLLALGVLAR